MRVKDQIRELERRIDQLRNDLEIYRRSTQDLPWRVKKLELVLIPTSLPGVAELEKLAIEQQARMQAIFDTAYGEGLQVFVPAPPPPITVDGLARLFHETYECLAPAFKYKTRQESAVSWDCLPKNNKQLMRAVCAEVLTYLNMRAVCAE